jgi:Ala-tRNA(Pro) deacylase
MSSSDSVLLTELTSLLDTKGASYRHLKHKALLRSDMLARRHGVKPEQVAKTSVIMKKLGRQSFKYYLAVIPGNCWLNLETIDRLEPGLFSMFAPVPIWENLTGCPRGTCPPFALHPELNEVLLDPALLRYDEIVFFSGSYTESISIQTDLYLEIAQPRIVSICADELRPWNALKDDWKVGPLTKTHAASPTQGQSTTA